MTPVINLQEGRRYQLYLVPQSRNPIAGVFIGKNKHPRIVTEKKFFDFVSYSPANKGLTISEIIPEETSAVFVHSIREDSLLTNGKVVVSLNQVFPVCTTGYHLDEDLQGYSRLVAMAEKSGLRREI